jgi:hypothetical protein
MVVGEKVVYDRSDVTRGLKKCFLQSLIYGTGRINCIKNGETN